MKGQRVIEGQRATRHLKVRATVGQLDDLRSVAADLGITQSDVIRQAVDEYVSDYRERTVFGGTPPGARGTLATR